MTGRIRNATCSLENDGNGNLTDVGPGSGPGFGLEKVGRALAYGDIDNDGDLDLLIVNAGQSTDLLRNDGDRADHSILVRTVGSESNRDGIGAELTLSVGNRRLARHVKAGSSYLAQNDMRVHFGLGEAMAAERLEIHWPSGQVDTIENIEANRIVSVREGEGIVDQVPFSAKSPVAP